MKSTPFCIADTRLSGHFAYILSCFFCLPIALAQEPQPNITTLNLEASRAEVSLPGKSTSYYILYRSTDLRNFSPVDGELGTDVEIILLDPESLPDFGFYRVKAVPIASPLDTDGDGIDDVYELKRPGFLNALEPVDPNQDTDGDGVPDLTEYQQGTDPQVPDNGTPPPPDSNGVANPLDASRIIPLNEATRFLFTGDNPIQTDLDPSVIDARRMAVIRGRVTNRNGLPLANVRITVLKCPEFGQTRTQADGGFDLVVNGGRRLTIDYIRDGYCAAQRTIDVPQGDYACVDDVVLVQLDPVVTAIDLTQADEPFQVAESSVVTDGDGSRQTALLFPGGLKAEMVLPNGEVRPCTSLAVRATEFTVGENGTKAMPGNLPPSSGYTYAVELSVDEAIAEGAVQVRFDRPVFQYVDNFLGFPVGINVPSGYYDRQKAAWIASGNGRVIGVVAADGEAAEIDVDGDGGADSGAVLDALGITAAELAVLAERFTAGESFWRVPIAHFSPWDANWGYVPPDDAEFPENRRPDRADKSPDGSSESCGSIIGVESQSLGESVAIVGTPFTLNYRSDQVPGRLAARFLDIPLSGSNLPESLEEITLTIDIAGRQFVSSFEPQEDLATTFLWDGLDAYGRPLLGTQRVAGKVAYTYDGVYTDPGNLERAFGRFSGLPVVQSQSRDGVDLLQGFTTQVGHPINARTQGIGGWLLDVQQFIDPGRPALIGGDGVRKTMSDPVSENLAGELDERPFDQPVELDFGPDGSLFVVGDNRIWKVTQEGTVIRAAGLTDNGDPFGDGSPATEAGLVAQSVAVLPDGTYYIGEESGRGLRRVTPDGIITTVTPPEELVGQINNMTVEAYLDGGILLAGGSFGAIWKIEPDGTWRLFAGDPDSKCKFGEACGDGGSAQEAKFGHVFRMAVAPDGSVYVADSTLKRVRRIAPDGTITTIAGSARTEGPVGDGSPALEARFQLVSGVALAPDGTVYVCDRLWKQVYQITADGILRTVAGCRSDADCPGTFGGPANATELKDPIDLAYGADGLLYIADRSLRKVIRIKPPFAGFGAGGFSVHSSDAETIYSFDGQGRHQETRHALTKSLIYRLAHDAVGRLVAIDDSIGNRTTIEWDEDGAPSAIVSPFGQRTALAVDAGGYLSRIANPAGEAWEFQYTEGGLLSVATNPDGKTSMYAYDELGLLVRATNAEGGEQTLDGISATGMREVTHETATTAATYTFGELSTGVEARSVSTAAGVTLRSNSDGAGGVRLATLPDGTAMTIELAPDPRYGMQAPYARRRSIVFPSGAELTVEAERTAEFADPKDPQTFTRVTEMITVGSDTATAVWDSAARTKMFTSPEGRTVVASLDESGRPSGLETSGSAPVAIEFGEIGRVGRITHGTAEGARVIEYSFDAQGRTTEVLDPEGRVVAYEYDGANRLITSTRPDGEAVHFGYDGAGNMISVTPPGRPAWSFSYDGRGELVRIIPPALEGTGPKEYVIASGPDARLAAVRRANGDVLEIGYDEGGRVASRNLVRGAVTIASYGITYDEADRVASKTAPGSVATTLAYDGALVTAEAWSGPVAGTVSTTYDDKTRLGGQSVNGGLTIVFTYDRDDLLSAAGDLTIGREAASGLVESTELGVVTTTATRDPFGSISTYAVTASGAPLFSENLTRDKLGRITEVSETVGGVASRKTFAYDAIGQLVSVKRDGLLVEEYGYDRNGNRVTAQTDGGAIRSAEFDVQDRAVGDGATTYDFNAAGELVTKSDGGARTSFGYDALGMLHDVGLPDGRQISYVVDADGRRIGKRINGDLVTGYLYAGGHQLVAELDGGGNVVSRFVWDGGLSPAWMIKGGERFRLVTDASGNVRMVLNASSGAVVQRLDYDAFGRVALDSNPGFQPFAFASGLFDRDTGLVLFGVRSYDPSTGRFMTRDPIGLAGGNTNLYVYVGNDPINRVDPFGLDETSWASVALGVVKGHLRDVTTPDPMSFMMQLAAENLGIDPLSNLSNLMDFFGLGGAINGINQDDVFKGELGYAGFSIAVGLCSGLRAPNPATATKAVSTVASTVASKATPKGMQVISAGDGAAGIARLQSLETEAVLAAKQAAKAAEESSLVLVKTRNGNIQRRDRPLTAPPQ